MTGDAVPKTVSTHVAQDYETLRTAALGEVLAVEARDGLALFLRRGMWGWAQATGNAGGLQRSMQPCVDAVDGDSQKRVVQLLAAMAMSSSDRRTYERSS
jgi:hypothetical protein